MIGGLGQWTVFLWNKGIVVFRAAGSGSGKTVSDFKSFDCANRKNCFCQTCIQFIKNRITNTGRDTIDHAFDDTAGRILRFDTLIEKELCLFCSLRIRHGNRILTDLCSIKTAWINGYRTDRFRISKNEDSHFF